MGLMMMKNMLGNSTSHWMDMYGFTFKNNVDNTMYFLKSAIEIGDVVMLGFDVGSEEDYFMSVTDFWVLAESGCLSVLG